MRTHRFRARLAASLTAASLGLCIVAAAAAAETATNLTASTASPVWGESVTFTATVATVPPATPPPEGSVQLKEGATSIGSPTTLSAGQASIPIDDLAVGAHSITATYTPTDSNTGSTSASVNFTVAKANTTTTATVAPDPTVAGQNATFSAKVAADTPSTGTPAGTVEFADQGGPAFDSGSLDALGNTSSTVWAFAGVYFVDVRYLGDDHFKPSSTTVLQRVNRAGTTTSLSLSPNPVAPGTTLNVDANVTVTPPGDVVPNGNLVFSFDGAPLGVPVTAPRYQDSFAAPPFPGTYVVRVNYTGDFDTEASFASVVLTIAAPPLPAPVAAPSIPVASKTPVIATVSVLRLNAMTAALTSALRTRGLAALASTVQTLAAPGPGVLEQKVYSPNAPSAARVAATKPAKPSLIASGNHRFPTAGNGTLRLKLTTAGRRAVKRSKATRIAIVTRFKPASGTSVVTTRKLTVKGKLKRGARVRHVVAG